MGFPADESLDEERYSPGPNLTESFASDLLGESGSGKISGDGRRLEGKFLSSFLGVRLAARHLEMSIFDLGSNELLLHFIQNLHN